MSRFITRGVLTIQRQPIHRSEFQRNCETKIGGNDVASVRAYGGNGVSAKSGSSCALDIALCRAQTIVTESVCSAHSFANLLIVTLWRRLLT